MAVTTVVEVGATTDSATESLTGSAPFALTASGVDSSTATTVANGVTGLSNRTESGRDVYTLSETGTAAGGAFSQGVVGTDNYTGTDASNSAAQTDVGTTTGGGTWTRTSSGPGSTLASGSGTNAYVLSTTGNAIAGVFGQSETGTDRYRLVQKFDDASNATSGQTPGNVTFHSHGLMLRDPSETHEHRLSVGLPPKIAKAMGLNPDGTPEQTDQVYMDNRPSYGKLMQAIDQKFGTDEKQKDAVDGPGAPATASGTNPERSGAGSRHDVKNGSKEAATDDSELWFAPQRDLPDDVEPSNMAPIIKTYKKEEGLPEWMLDFREWTNRQFFRKNTDDTIGPGYWWEDIVPVYGSGRRSLDAFNNGRYGSGIVFGFLAITDVFLVKSLVTGGIKLGGIVSAKVTARTAARAPAAVEGGAKALPAVARTETGLALQAERQLAKAGKPIPLADVTLGSTCFVGGTPLLTPEGFKRIEEFRPGDRILSRPEDDLYGWPEAKEVEAVFTRVAPTLLLTVNGKVIETTGEHPFYVMTRGWRCANELEPGDILAGHDVKYGVVEAVADSGRVADVYNLRVADWHTYFVGGAEWGFSVWAHNAECAVLFIKEDGTFALKGAQSGKILREGTQSELEAFATKYGHELTLSGLPRTPPRLEQGNLKEGWAHIEARHVPGGVPQNAPAGFKQADLFAHGTTKTQIENASAEIIKDGTRVSDPARQIQTFEKKMTINGKRANYRLVVDSADKNRIITLFPVEGG